MRSPNKEQRTAIEHNGNVLLNAGAGSGKTFVLIEHIHYLVESFLMEHKELNDIEVALELKKMLDKKVLMTFTNDAAAEIRERLVRRFDSYSNTDKDFVVKCVGALNVSTIHGFCLKLLKSGVIQGAPSIIDISDEYQINRKIELLVQKWFKFNSAKISDNMFKNYTSLIKGMQYIFASPELRLQWLESTEDDENIFDEGKYFKNIIDVLEINSFWESQSDLGPFEDFSGKAWFELLKGFNTIKSRPLSWQSFKDANELFSSIGRLTSSKKMTASLMDNFDDAKKLREFLKKNFEDLDYFFNHQEEFSEWQQVYGSLFSFIHEGYFKSPGFSFADLEFVVLNSMRTNEQTLTDVRAMVDYLIVDEYQDTSWVQYEIIKYVIDKDYSRLFCVGDRKQAIYGFRGGELGVFNETSSNVERQLKLKNNYRSEERVVDFNNTFFDFLFKLGTEFKGIDSHSVEVDYQDFPSEVKPTGGGSATRLNCSVDDENIIRVNPALLNEVESSILFSRIMSLLESGEDEICILYKNLAPSKLLIQKLIESRTPFQAQVKVPFSEDPVITIFSALIDFFIEIKKDSETEKRWSRSCKYFNFYISAITREYFEHEKQISENDLSDMYRSLTMTGIEVAFVSLFYKLGLANSSYENNFKKIKSIISGCNGNIDSIWLVLKSLDDKSYSTKMSFLSNPKITIMTSHASKGLQFDNVLIGGIHTNGRKVVNKESMGRGPGAYRWSSDVEIKKLHKSPEYIFENMVRTLKEFSESKRLLYVVATRAVKRIEWADITVNGKSASSTKESWVNGLRLFNSDLIENESFEYDGDLNIIVNKAPMFFDDQLGISSRSCGSQLGIIAELSVTKLAMIALCPTKFYISQILKLEDDWKEFALESEIEIMHRKGISDADRGTKVHGLIEKMIKGSYVTDEKFSDIISWVKSLLDKYDQNTLISEKEMKFSFFGQMITGIPDLIIQDNEIEIWDFKTGLCDEDDKRSYFFQLMTYAYGLAKISDLSDQVIILKLVLLDKKEIIEQKIDISALSGELFELWKNVSKISRTKISHCDICMYGNLCHS